jgi:hypothetical protein
VRRFEPLLAGLVSGSLGRGLAFAGDFAAALWRTFRGDPRHPEERKI